MSLIVEYKIRSSSAIFSQLTQKANLTNLACLAEKYSCSAI